MNSNNEPEVDGKPPHPYNVTEKSNEEWFLEDIERIKREEKELQEFQRQKRKHEWKGRLKTLGQTSILAIPSGIMLSATFMAFLIQLTTLPLEFFLYIAPTIVTFHIGLLSEDYTHALGATFLTFFFFGLFTSFLIMLPVLLVPYIPIIRYLNIVFGSLFRFGIIYMFFCLLGTSIGIAVRYITFPVTEL